MNCHKAAYTWTFKTNSRPYLLKGSTCSSVLRGEHRLGEHYSPLPRQMSGKDLLCVIWFSRQINTLIDMPHLTMVVLSFTFTLLHLRVILKSSWKWVFLAPLQAGYLPEADCLRNTRRSFTFDLLFLPSLPFINSHEKLCSLFYLTCLCLQWEKGVEPVSVPAICLCHHKKSRLHMTTSEH